MDPEWREVNQIQLSPAAFDGFGNAQNNTTDIGALAFDTQQELLWVGDHHGEVTSYYGWRLEIYTKFRAHPPDDGPVKQFLFDDKRVLSLTAKSLHCSTRRGLPQWHTTYPAMRDMSCMTFNEKGNSVILAGAQEVMLKINVSSGDVVQEMPTLSKYMMMRHWRSHICAATNTGSVDILDSETLSVRKQWNAHSSRVADMDAKNDFLITCGWTVRSHGGPAPEPIAKVFNLRNMEQFPPISFPAGASFVQIHPKLHSTCVIASRNGQLQVIDITTPDAPANIRYMLTHIDMLIMSPSGNVWLMADDQNTLHLLGASDNLGFNDNPEPTDFAAPSDTRTSLPFDSDEPYSLIGMPYYKEHLLSAWGVDQIFEVGRPGLDAEAGLIVEQSKWGPIAKNTSGTHRNQTVSKVKTKTNGNHAPHLEASLLGPYANVRIKYGSHGISGFDFQSHNKTHFSGLESDIQHSYLNSLLQLFKYTPCVRNAALAHVTGNCLASDCLLCELAFLFDNLEKARGINCQATNFLNTYNSLNLAKGSGEMGLDVKTVQAVRGLLPHLAFDSHRVVHQNNAISSFDQMSTIRAWVGLHCMRCETRPSPREELFHALNLVYMDQTNLSRAPTFSDLLNQSLARESYSKGWCNRCRTYPQLKQRRLYSELPPALTISALTERDQLPRVSPWATPGWLPQTIGIAFNTTTGIIRCAEENLDELVNQTMKDDVVYIYDLVGVVVQIYNAEDHRSHLVSLINVNVSDANPDSPKWHLFNDFSVQELSSKEALYFDPSWKMPVILMYQVRHRRDLDDRGNLIDYRRLDDSWKTCLDPSCLYQTGSLIPENGFPLTDTEERQLSHVAIDAEFVLLGKEQFDIAIDGKKKTMKPKRQAIGRVSVLHAGGAKYAVPFVDDYIEVLEPIIDHQTQYSGLEIGDLEFGKSRYNLQSLKVVYRKLWLLLNDNVVFVGHGLASDFRVLNLSVPKDQVIDTVELFKLPDGRNLSLRYLAWFFLEGEDRHVQTGNHDSIVDARTALHLWRKSEELKQSNTFHEQLQEAYDYGHRTKYLPPEEFKALQQQQQLQQQQARIRGGILEVPSGRVTPEAGGSSSAAGSAPTTPEPRGRGRGRGREGEVSGLHFVSPLR